MTKPIIKLEVGNCCPVAFGPIYRTSTVSNRILYIATRKQPKSNFLPQKTWFWHQHGLTIVINISAVLTQHSPNNTSFCIRSATIHYLPIDTALISAEYQRKAITRSAENVLARGSQGPQVEQHKDKSYISRQHLVKFKQ